MKMGKFLNQIDLAAAMWRQNVQNSQVKRGVLDLSDSVREYHVICECGDPGCGFISHLRKPKDGAK